MRSLPAEHVSLELRSAEQDVELVSGNATFHIRTLRAEDFPPFPEPDPDSSVELPADAFVSTALKVAGSASRDETRPVLTGILVSASDRELRMVATDSYRLSVKETTLEAPLSSGFEVNVPARALQELARLVSHAEDEPLSVSVRQNQVLFTLGRVILSSRLIDGQFPNYRQLLPETFEHELRLAWRRADRGGAADQPAGAEERAAAARLRRGRADRLGADARRRRGARVDAGGVHRASRWRSASTPSSSAPAWRRSTRATCC